MRSVLVVLAAIGVAMVVPASRESFARSAEAFQGPRPLGITNVTVIDVERGARLRDQTVIIEGGRISTVGPSSQVRVPDGYGVVPIPRIHVEGGTDRGGAVHVDSREQIPDGMVVREELRRAVEGGLAPAAALKALTVDAARSLGWQDHVGSVAPGRFGDLIILDANPLEDIRNTTRINAILVGGRFVDSDERQRLLAGLAPR